MTISRNAKIDEILNDAEPSIADHWKSCREFRLEIATQARTDAVDAAIARYFDNLKALPEPAVDEEILAKMKTLYGELEEINADSGYSLLETDERELLVPVFIEAAAAARINPDDYEGEPGGEFRDF
jgi:hypothetical protein